MQSHLQQLIQVADANGWSVHGGVDAAHTFTRKNSDGLTSFIGIRVGKRQQLTAAGITSGRGVIYTPRRDKFREVCVALSTKKI